MEYLHKTLCKKMFCGKKVTKLPDLTVSLILNLLNLQDNFKRALIHETICIWKEKSYTSSTQV
jgi:hypothetical protein